MWVTFIYRRTANISRESSYRDMGEEWEIWFQAATKAFIEIIANKSSSSFPSITIPNRDILLIIIIIKAMSKQNR